MKLVSNLIISYLKYNNVNLHGQILQTVEDDCVCISCFYLQYDITVLVYNDNFIKLKINHLPYTICDSIKTFRTEIDRLNNLRYY
jgi:hypothetical protein